MGLLGFFTRPDTSTLWWSAVLLFLTIGLTWWAAVATRPPRPKPDAPTPELGTESPAVASLLTNGFVVGPPAAVATLLDLVARGWLRIEHAGHEVILLTDQRGREGDVLTRYEQQVLNHIHKLTAGTLTGVSGAGVEVAGLRLRPRWMRRFARFVVADARRQGLCKRRWNAVTLALPAATLAMSALTWWSAVRSGPDIAVSDSVPSRTFAGLVAVGILGSALRLIRRARSLTQRPTIEGAQRMKHWMALRAWMEPRGFEGASSGVANNPSRALAYAAALGLADRASEELPIVPEDDRLAWSNATGDWHVVRVRYPFRPGYGRHPAFVLLIGLGGAIAFFLLHRLLLGVARGEALTGFVDDFPDQADWIERVALAASIVVLVPLAWMGWLVVAGAFDLFATVRRQGLVVRARRPQRVLALPRLLRPLAKRDRFALFIAVDDGRGDRVSAWLANERTAVPQGARARVFATPMLGYIRRSEPIGATRTSVELSLE